MTGVVGVVGVLAVVVVVEAMQGEESGKMQSYVQPRQLLLWAHWTSPCKLGPPGRTSIVGAFNYQLLASGCPPGRCVAVIPNGLLYRSSYLIWSYVTH